MALASFFTLGLLSSFVAAPVLAFMYYTDTISIFWLFALTVLINLVIWLVSPRVSDIIYRFFYDVEWITLEELRQRSPEAAQVIEEACEDYDFSTPKLGIIPDDNPNAFTYGSGRFNSRVVATQGLFKYLDGNEAGSVYAHEMGHVVHRDFIVMTVANMLVQMLYEMYIVFRRLSLDSDSESKARKPILGLMVATLVFYFIGRYVVLFLSRLREYYADRFAGERTDPNYLSSALIKISYGILASPDNERLVKSTEAIGIQNFDNSEDIGLVYYNSDKLSDWNPLNRALMYDLVNPWAKLSELKSTHPLTGKRIKALSDQSRSPVFDFEQIKKNVTVDRSKLYGGFFKDLFVIILPTILAVTFPILYGLGFFMEVIGFQLGIFVGGWIATIGLAMILRTLYKYPTGEPEDARVIDLMADLYASPVRGKKVRLRGKLIGRGEAGLKFSEDLMFQDSTGIMFLNYQSWLPYIGNLLFGLGKVPELVGEEAEIKGWFLRDTMPWIGLKHLETENDSIRGFVRFGSLIGGVLITVVGTAVAVATTTGIIFEQKKPRLS